MNANFNKTAYLNLKQELKDLAQQIRKTRFQYKEAQRNNLIRVANKLLRQLLELSYNARHKHIAYSELRGRTRDQIERPREGNKPNERLIQKIKDQSLTPEPVEELCCA